MGLEYVELIMAVEEKFQVEISDEEAASLKTPGQLTDLVWEKVKVRKVISEANTNDFKKLVLIISETRSIDPEKIGRETPLEELFPKETRIKDWEKMRHAFCGRPTFPLSKPARIRNRIWLSTGIFALASILACICLCYFRRVNPEDNLLFSILSLIICPVIGILIITIIGGIKTANALAPPMGCCYILLFFLGIAVPYALRGIPILSIMVSAIFIWHFLVSTLTKRHMTEFPSDIKTVGDLCSYLNPENWRDRTAVWFTTKRIIMEQIGVSEDQVTEDTRFIEDLVLCKA